MRRRIAFRETYLALDSLAKNRIAILQQLAGEASPPVALKRCCQRAAQAETVVALKWMGWWPSSITRGGTFSLLQAEKPKRLPQGTEELPVSRKKRVRSP